MTKAMFMATLMGFGLLTGAAQAQEPCQAQMADWQPVDALMAKAETLGWSVRGVRPAEGCYLVAAVDKEGRPLQAKFDPASMQLLSFQVIALSGEDDEGMGMGEGEHEDDDDEGGSQPRPPAAAPNPLIGTPKAATN